MKQLWAGRAKKQIAQSTNDFNSSISFDSRMFEEDIKGSIAHVTMLGKKGIIAIKDSQKIIDTLVEILEEIKDNKLKIDMQSEDIHTNLLFSVAFAAAFAVGSFLFPKQIMGLYSKDLETVGAAESYLLILSGTFLPMAGTTMLAALF